MRTWHVQWNYIGNNPFHVHTFLFAGAVVNPPVGTDYTVYYIVGGVAVFLVLILLVILLALHRKRTQGSYNAKEAKEKSGLVKLLVWLYFAILLSTAWGEILIWCIEAFLRGLNSNYKAYTLGIILEFQNIFIFILHGSWKICICLQREVSNIRRFSKNFILERSSVLWKQVWLLFLLLLPCIDSWYE